ncbi:MAG: hypothetical protein ACYTBP_17725 [Planctomycetota bacterium]|jgi:hypothetical protein
MRANLTYRAFLAFMVLLIVGASYPGSSAHQAAGENTTVDENLPSEIRIEPKTLTFERESLATTQGAGSSGSNALNKLIHFKRGTIHPGQTSSSDKIGINKGARLNQFNQLATKRKHVLVQFKRLLLPKEIRSFEQNGIIILRYIPNYAYLIGISEITKASETMEQSGLLEWTWIPHEFYKQSLEISKNEFAPTSRFPDETVLALC